MSYYIPTKTYIKLQPLMQNIWKWIMNFIIKNWVTFFNQDITLPLHQITAMKHKLRPSLSTFLPAENSSGISHISSSHDSHSHGWSEEISSFLCCNLEPSPCIAPLCVRSNRTGQARGLGQTHSQPRLTGHVTSLGQAQGKQHPTTFPPSEQAPFAPLSRHWKHPLS